MYDKVIINDSARFDEIINQIEKDYFKIKDIFEKEKRNSQEINGTDTWNSNGQVALYNKYVELMENFGPIEYSMDLYIKFLRKTLEDYRRFEDAVQDNMEEFSSELDVNS